MSFDWTQDDSAAAPRLPLGQDTEVEITRIVFGNRDGPFRASAGDPRIMVILADDQGREVSTMVTLSEKAGWVLRSILSAASADRAKMQADGVSLADFADEEFAKANLIGRRLAIRVKHYLDDSGTLGEIAALRPRPRISTDDIPI
jgi:hypothetical protein